MDRRKLRGSSGRGRGIALITGLVGLVGVGAYLAVVEPMMHPERWTEKQKAMRSKHTLEETQPGGLKVWEDPFRRKNKDD